jgi:hypothetical protein
MAITVCVALAERTKQRPQQQKPQQQAPPVVRDSDIEEDDYVPIKEDGRNAFDWKLVKVIR